MHIGIDARLTYYRLGGISTYINGLLQALQQLNSRHSYTIFRSRKMLLQDYGRFAQAGLWTPAHHRLERLALSVELARFQLDLLHSPDFIPPYRGARRHIITVHDLTFLRYPQFLTPDARRYYNANIRAAVKHADHILTESQSTRDDLRLMLDVPLECVTVHPLGVDARYQPLSPAVLASQREELRLPDTYILFVGTFEPRKNILGLLRAYESLVKRLPDLAPIVLAGSRGWLFDETQAAIDAMALAHHIVWRENVPQQLMPALYNGARVLVMPSHYEGFGLPALEAMACGTPTIVSDRSSLPEVVGDVGLQVNPDDPQSIADAIQRAVSDDAWHASEREKALRRAATFTWERTAQITLQAYERLL